MVPRRTRATLQVVAAILARPDHDHYGLDLMRQTGVKAGTMYPILDRLQGDGWLTSRWEDEGASRRPRKRLYRLTPLGREQGTELLASVDA